MLLLQDATETDATEKLTCSRSDEVSCNKLASDCIAHTLSHFPQAVIHLETELPDSTCLLTNRFYLMCILRELLYNAARFSDGTHIVLSVEQTDTTVLFTVQDVGPGLPDPQPSLDFKPFTATEGTGLGLPLAQRHAAALGGCLTIDPDYRKSCYFKGCKITVEMPK
jgi:signal transduction histidine kinase